MPQTPGSAEGLEEALKVLKPLFEGSTLLCSTPFCSTLLSFFFYADIPATVSLCQGGSYHKRCRSGLSEYCLLWHQCRYTALTAAAGWLLRP